MSNKTRIEKDSMGEMQVPADALYAAQTQRAVENFPISGLALPRSMIRALGLVKAACAHTNQQLGLLDNGLAAAIEAAANAVASGDYDGHFPIDIFQTGSGTSSNMNSNEVIARLASQQSGLEVHPNDHVNMGQSSNDVFPTAIHVAASLQLHERLLPALEHLAWTIESRATELAEVTKTGRTHLMDAMPVTLGQELSGWAAQVRHGIERIRSALPRIQALTLGGTAVGTGINAHAEMGSRVAARLAETSSVPFTSMDNFFEGLSSQDAAVEVSGQLKTVATSMMKIANDLRWMNSGPIHGLAEINLPALQPGSSIMPGKVNPVVPESVAMVGAQVMGLDSANAIAGQSGNFQLNVMLPLIAGNLLDMIGLLGNAASMLADKAIRGFTVNTETLDASVGRNPVLVTALNPEIGYSLASDIAKEAYKTGRPVIDVAEERSGLSRERLEELMDPLKLTQGGGT